MCQQLHTPPKKKKNLFKTFLSFSLDSVEHIWNLYGFSDRTIFLFSFPAAIPIQRKKIIGRILIQLEVLAIGMTKMLLILSLFVGWILISLQRLKTYLNFSFYCLGFRKSAF